MVSDGIGVGRVDLWSENSFMPASKLLDVLIAGDPFGGFVLVQLSRSNPVCWAMWWPRSKAVADSSLVAKPSIMVAKSWSLAHAASL